MANHPKRLDDLARCKIPRCPSADGIENPAIFLEICPFLATMPNKSRERGAQSISHFPQPTSQFASGSATMEEMVGEINMAIKPLRATRFHQRGRVILPAILAVNPLGSIRAKKPDRALLNPSTARVRPFSSARNPVATT
jgi:hypothetical protein